MPDPKDKYSDEKLNTADQAFDEIVNRPDMQALNDQGDAVARDLEAAETSPKQGKQLDPSDADGAHQAEKDNAQAPDNPFNYSRSAAPERSKATSGWSNKRKLLVAGGVGGGIIGILASLMLLLPMKVPGLLSLATDKAGQRLEQITEKRAKLIVGRAILTKFGTHSGIVLTGEGALKTLVVSMRTSGFEKRLAAKGLIITATKDGVTLTQNGKPLGGGKSLKNEKQILDALESNKVSNKVIKDIVKEDIPSWRWMKRAKFAKWLRIKYGIPRYGLTQSDKSTEEERAKDYDKQRVESANKRVFGNFTSLVQCLMSGSCDKVNGSTEPSKASQADAQTKPIEDVTKVGDAYTSEVSAKGLRGVTTKLSEMLLKMVGSKAIPIIGWIDIVATIDHMANSLGEDDYFGKVVSYYRGAAYAGIFAEWAGYGSQIQLGGIEPSYVGQLASELDGAEEAVTFQEYDNNPGKGTPIELTVNSDNPSEVSKAFKTYTDSAFGEVFHAVLNAYYETVGGGGFLGWLSGGIGKVIGFLSQPMMALWGAITPDSLKQLAIDQVKKAAPYMLKTFGLTIDAFERGAKLYNNIVGGAEVSMNQYCMEQGCRRLTDDQAFAQNTLIHQENEAYKQQKGLAYMLFSPDEPTSLSSQLVYKTPSSPTATLALIGRAVADTPAKLVGMITPRTQAATMSSNLFNIAMYGATTSDLNRPLSQAFLNGGGDGEGCPEVPEGEFNDCTIDTLTAEAMICEFDPNSADCSDTDSTTSPTSENSFTVASYNILHSISHTANSLAIGGCKQNPVQGDPTCGLTRAGYQAQIITGQEGSNPAFDLIATQETSAEQYNALRGLLTGYDVYPDNPNRLSNSEDGAVAMFWNKSKFTRFAAGKTPGISNTSKDITNPWVGLQLASGQKVYFMSIHYANSTFGGTASSIIKSSNLTMDWVRSKAVDDNIVIVGGDFNDALGQKLSYCVYTKNGLMQHAVDMAAGADPMAGCTALRFRGIDHIYATPVAGLTAANWTHAPDTGIYAKASDHTPVYVTYNLPGATGNVAVGDWSWPVDKKWWTTSRADFLSPHPTYSGTFTSPYVRGVAADIGNPPDGSPVYSMLGGKVVKTNLCGSGDGMIIESDTSQGKLQIAYGHGTKPRYKVGDTVRSGDHILDLGAIGCQVNGGHLHVDMALGSQHICPQDVFLAMGAGTNPDLVALTKKATAPCAR